MSATQERETIVMADSADATRAMIDATDGTVAVVYVKVAPDSFLFCHGHHKTVATFGGFCNKGEPALDAALRELDEESCGAIRETREGALRRLRHVFRKSIGPTYVFVLDYSDEPVDFVKCTRQNMTVTYRRLYNEDPVANKVWLQYDDLVTVTHHQIKAALADWGTYKVAIRPGLALPFRPVLKSMLARLIEIESPPSPIESTPRGV